jgi:hypothetical protein
MIRGDAEPPDYKQNPGAFVSSIAFLLSGAAIVQRARSACL